MAGEFTVSIGVDLELAEARAGLNQFLKEAAKGVSVPVRAGVGNGGGQGAPASPRVSSAEQAAVDRAMARVQGHSYAAGGGPGGGSISPRIDTNDAQIALRRVRGIYDELRTHLERPIVLRVDTSGVDAALSKARSPARGVASSGFDPDGWMDVPQAGERRRARRTRRGTVSPVDGDDITSLRDELFGESTRNLADLRRQTSPGVVSTVGARRGLVGRGRTYGLPTDTARGLLGLLAVGEVQNVLEAGATADLGAALATNRIDAMRARAQGIQAQTSGFFGSALALAWNATGASNSPSTVLRDLNEGIGAEELSAQARSSRFANAGSEAFRTGYRQNGRGAAEIARLQVETKQQSEGLKRDIEFAQAQLQERTAVVTRYAAGPGGGGQAFGSSGGALVITGQARTAKQEMILANQDTLERLAKDQAFAETQYNRDLTRSRSSAENRTRRLAMVAQNRSPRAIARQELRDSYQDRLYDDIEQFGETEGRGRNASELNAALSAQRFTDIMQSRQAGGERFFGRAIGAFQRFGSRIDNFAQFNRRSAAQGRVTQALIDRNPEGADIAASDAQIDEQISGTRFLPFGIRQLTQRSIRNAGEQQQRLIRRQYNEQRFEAGDALDAEMRQSRFRQAGGSFRVDAELDSIITDTRRDARSFERSGESDLATKRRTLGVQQIREAQANYYRGFDFVEGSPNRIAGSLNLDAQAKKFKDAEAQIGKSKDGGPSDSEKGPTGEQMQALINLVQQFYNKNFRAKAS